MIDEKKLIDEIEDRRRYWENYAADQSRRVDTERCRSSRIQLAAIISK